ncbi:DUF6542 domain-containing protein [Streptomyces decoyicus]|uniref:DUF6542 domain-containing protein n=1 Tax=Streptomyces decoyicus TaxID=249567 RepID=UPI003F4C78C1
MEQHEARTPQHSPPRSARPPAGQDARLPRPAEAVAPDPDDDFLTAMRASGFASVPASAPAAVHAAARGPAQAGPARAPARAPATAAPGRAPAPPQGVESSTVYRARPQRPALPAAAPALRRRMPAAKLTGLGCWLLATVALLAFAFLDRLLFGGAPTAYGVCYLLVGVAAALWVRPYDLVIAPVTLPIAFTLGALPIQRGADGFDGLLMGVFTVLALNAGWLYAGTLICALLAIVRRVLIIARRRASRPASRPQSGPHGQQERPPARTADRGRPRPGNRPRQVARQPERRTQPSRPPQSPRCSEAEPARSPR